MHVPGQCGVGALVALILHWVEGDGAAGARFGWQRRQSDEVNVQDGMCYAIYVQLMIGINMYMLHVDISEN